MFVDSLDGSLWLFQSALMSFAAFMLTTREDCCQGAGWHKAAVVNRGGQGGNRQSELPTCWIVAIVIIDRQL